jgi:hypothetical protein
MWEMALLSLIALACAAALLVAARSGRDPLRLPSAPAVRTAGVVAAVGLMAVMLPGIAAHRAGAAADRALERADWSEALRQSRTAIRWAPWWSWGYQARGDAQAGLGRLPEARRDLREAARRDPGDWRIWFDLGNAGSGQARLAAWRRAARLNPLEEDIQVIRPRLRRARARS